MTFASLSFQRPWVDRFVPGSSVSLAESVPSKQKSSEIVLTPGTSSTSSNDPLRDKYLHLIFDKIRWEDALSSRFEDVEEDLYVFFPPKNQYTVNLHARFVGRAKPLLYFDDEEIELNGD